MGKKQKLTTFRGIDPEKDFQQPVRREPSSESEPQQESLGTDVEGAPAPAVNGRKILAKFVRCRPDANEDGDRFINLEMAITLSKENVEILPLFLRDAFDTVAKRHATLLGLNTDEVLYVGVFLAGDDQAPEISLDGRGKPFAIVPEKIKLQSVEEKGSTKARQIIRLSFTLPIPQTGETALWGCNNHGNLIWLELEEANRRLPLKAARA